jgi:hypothetical protein
LRLTERSSVRTLQSFLSAQHAKHPMGGMGAMDYLGSGRFTRLTDGRPERGALLVCFERSVSQYRP